MYTTQAIKYQIVVLYVFAGFFVVMSVFAYFGHSFGAAIFFLMAGLLDAIYTAHVARSSISFRIEEPTLVIRNGFSGPVSVQPSDCISLGTSIGRVTSDKLTYRAKGSVKSIVVYGGYKDQVGWSRYTRKYLDDIRTNENRMNINEFEKLNNPAYNPRNP